MRPSRPTLEGQLFRRLFDHTPLIAWVHEPSGQCSYVSPAWYEHTGLPPGSAEGNGWMAAVHPEDMTAIKNAYTDAIEHSKIFEVTFRLRRAEGGYARVDARGTLRGDGAKAEDIFGICFPHADHKSIVPALGTPFTNSLTKLTPRERDVLQLLTAGETSGNAATLLGISPRTVEVHRAHLMTKLGARNAADLTRIAMLMSAKDAEQ